MKPSIYQEAIFNWVSNNQGNLLVQALAGSGKTTTIVKAIELIPPDQRVLFCAFNKHIAEELSRRVPSHCVATTLNSFGWRACIKEWGRLKLDANKVDNILRFRVFDIRLKADKDLYYKVRYSITKLVSLLRAHNIGPNDAGNFYDQLMDKHDIEMPEKVPVPIFESYLKQAYKYTLNDTNTLDFDDQIFMPVHFDLPVDQYDWVLVDEAQDLNPVQIKLIGKIGKRIIAVGDKNQAIYGFRGADPEAMNNIKNAFNCDELPLNVCYRCPTEVINEAKKIVPEIEAADNAQAGEVISIKEDKFEETVKDGEYVLCRTTAPLVSKCLGLIKQGRKATVKGRDIGQNLVTLAKTICNGNIGTTTVNFLDLLGQYESREMEKLGRLNKEAAIVSLGDRLDTLKVLVAEGNTVNDLIIKVESIFSDSNSSGVTFMTVHKSKGLEADNIYILHPELLPHPMAKQEWQRIQEKNLKYVAITRSKNRLVWVNQ